MADVEGNNNGGGAEDGGFSFAVGEWAELIGEDIQYKVLSPGQGPIAEVNNLIRCRYVGRLQATNEVFERTEVDTGYRIGDNDTTPGLELGLRHMRKGEKGLVRCSSKYGFGPLGRPQVAPGAEVAVPPDAALEYEIEVIEVLPPFSPKDSPTVVRVAEAELKKRHGNGFFHHLDYNRAIRCYQAGLKALDAEAVDEEEETEEVYKAMVKMFCDISNNLAAALMKLERWKDAKEVCVKVIEVDKDNVKALFRGGQAALNQDNFEEAELALVEAAKLAPKDPLIRAAVHELHRKKAEYVAKEKKMYKTMAGFLTRPAATGIGAEDAGGQKKEKEEEKKMKKEEKEEVVESEEEEEEEETEQEEEEAPDEGIPAPVPAQEQVQEVPVHPWLAWYIRHREWFVTAAFLLLPLLFVWEDVKASWVRRLAGAGAGGGGEDAAGGGTGSEF